MSHLPARPGLGAASRIAGTLVVVIVALGWAHPSAAAPARPIVHIEGYGTECQAYHSNFGVLFCDHSTFLERSISIFDDRRVVAFTTTQIVDHKVPQQPIGSVRESRLTRSAYAQLRSTFAAQDIGHHRGQCDPWAPRVNDPIFLQTWRWSWYGGAASGAAITLTPFGTPYQPVPCPPQIQRIFDAILAAAAL